MKTSLPKDAPGNLMKWLSKEDRLFGYVMNKDWYDIGDMKSLKEADKRYFDKEKLRKENKKK